MKVERWLTGALLSFAATACSGGNSGEVELAPGLAAAVPWANGAVPTLNPDGSLVQSNMPVFPTISWGTPDPGSQPIDCSPLAAIEPAPLLLQTFEPDPTVPNSVGNGIAYSSYDDGTFGSFRVTGDVSWYPGNAGRFNIVNWGLASDPITDGPTCDGTPNGWAMHFRGGRFNYYGAGIENPVAAIQTCPPGSDVCPAPALPGATTDPVGFPLLNPSTMQPYQQQAPHQYWDVSGYDGVVLWARCGPDSAADLLVTLQDKHTSDDLNRENQTFCNRIKTCYPTCLNGLPCTLEVANTGNTSMTTNLDSSPRYRCFDPAVGMATNIAATPSLIEAVYPVCGPSACLSPEYDVDVDFDPTECKAYEFTGDQAGYFCYGSQPPPTEDERCGDGWVAPVTLTTDWQIFVVPFTQFRQVGFGKPAPYMDLHSIEELSFEVPVGWSDIYIDNVTFYRQH